MSGHNFEVDDAILEKSVPRIRTLPKSKAEMREIVVKLAKKEIYEFLSHEETRYILAKELNPDRSRGSGLGEVLSNQKIIERYQDTEKLSLEDWAGPMMCPSEFSNHIGVSRQTLFNWKENGEIITLPKGKASHQIPLLQLAKHTGQLLPGIKEVLTIAEDPVEAWLWLMRPHIDFDEAKPIDALQAGEVDTVLDSAERNLAIR